MPLVRRPPPRLALALAALAALGALGACARSAPAVSPSSAEAAPWPEWRRVPLGPSGVSVETPGPALPQALPSSTTLVLVQEMAGGAHAEARVGEEEKPEGWTFHAGTAARRDALGRDVSPRVTGPMESTVCRVLARTYTVEEPEAILEVHSPLRHQRTAASTTLVTVFRAGPRGVTLVWRVPTARRAESAGAERRFLESVRCDGAPAPRRDSSP